VIDAVPLLPSLVAVIVAEPAATAVTTPLAETVATPVALLDHVTVRPVRTLLAESVVVALSCVLPPTRRATEAGVTATDETGTMVTVMAAVPVLPSLVAVMVAEPAATAATTPLAETDATPGALLDHVTGRPFRMLLAESFVVALSCTDVPTRRLALAGKTLTVATGTADTVTLELPLCPSLVAVIVTVPRATALTRPSTVTDATLGASLDHVIVRPLKELPDASTAVAMKNAVVPTRRFAVGGATSTRATGTMATVIAAEPLRPSLVAVIVAMPAAMPETTPVAETVATAGASLDQVTARPVRRLPAASRVVAIS